MYCIIQGDSDLELSDQENLTNGDAGVERESSEEEAGGSSDEPTDTDEQENLYPRPACTIH